MNEKINVAIPADYSGTPITINLLEGKTPDPINLSSYEAKGKIESPTNWLRHRGPDPQTCHVMANPRKGKIDLWINPALPYDIKVLGEAKMNPDMLDFGINNGKRYSPESLAEYLRLKRRHFASLEQFSKLLINLRKHFIAINAEIEKSSDDRGNGTNNNKVSVTSNIDEKFTLEMPIIDGGQKVKFEVDIVMEIRDKGITIWLSSVELDELSEYALSELVMKEVDEIRSMNYLVIIE